jgi:hypothetical protein
VITVPASAEMDDATLRLHIELRHPLLAARGNFTRYFHANQHITYARLSYYRAYQLDHIHLTDEYLRNHRRVVKVRGKASEYQCLLCFDWAECWAHLWRTHPDKTNVWNYEAMCWQDHNDYDYDYTGVHYHPSVAVSRKFAGPGIPGVVLGVVSAISRCCIAPLPASRAT